MEPLEGRLYAQGPWCGAWQELTLVLLAIMMTVMTTTAELAMMTAMAVTMMRTVMAITVMMTTVMLMMTMMTTIIHTGGAFSCVGVASVPGVLYVYFIYYSP